MIELTNYDVTVLDTQECESVQGGSDFSYAVGYTARLMLFNMDDAIDNALGFYFGGR